MKDFISEKEIDALLPQTQCGLCGYGGCMPYAKALSEKTAPINLCPPGGVETLRAIGELLHVDPQPYEAEMTAQAKPFSVAKIREAECIGCTKCIQVCPVDAILGSAKTMHAVISDECTGCELCVPACPVDCIDMLLTSDNQKTKRDHYRNRFLARQQRMTQQKKKSVTDKISSLPDKQSYIQAAIARARAKKLMGK